MCETEGKGVTGVRREVHSKKLHNLYVSQNIIHIIRSGKLNVAWIWSGFVWLRIRTSDRTL
jgi:hypothetical protein